ncbi:MAG TPA: ShlB/FhaC/HecB family hemolysin secretion/activation protein [Caulobacteraceae bacterium]
MPRLLAPFIGRPLSRRLVSDIETRIVQRYRRRGRPFVQVSLPEQEVDQGVLTVRVVEFHLGKIKVEGVSPKAATDLAQAIRRQRDGGIDTGRLSQDLDWLNRDPFRNLTASFAPGTSVGATDLTLTATQARRWQVFAGYADSGAPSTGQDRYFVGASAEIIPAMGAVLSLQVTGSPDFWADRGELFGQSSPLYRSASGRLDLPITSRQALDISLDAEESNFGGALFSSRQQTVEASAIYRAALSNLVPAPGDVSLGVEARRQTRQTYFGGLAVAGASVGVYQLLLGWTGDEQDRFGRSTIDLNIHVSPGHFNASNTNAALAQFSLGRVRGASYGYAHFNFSRTTDLPHGLTLATQLTGQYADQAIPNSEQFAIGGVYAVRGYSLDDGAYDDGLILRDELRAQGPPLIQLANLIIEQPFLFGDLGHARDYIAQRALTIGSVGVGGSLRFGRASASLSFGDPLADGPSTRVGRWRADIRVEATY